MPLLLQLEHGSKELVRIAAIGDLHYGRTSQPGSLQPLFSQINDSADVLALCGDLTDYGLRRRSARACQGADPGGQDSRSSPCSAITTSSRASRTRSSKILKDAGVTVLDGETTEIHGIGFAGVKGFCRRLRPARARPVGRGDHQAFRARSGRRGAEARIRAGAPAQRTSRRARSTTRRSRPRSKGSRSRSIRSSAAAASRSRSRASPSAPCSTATRITARPKGRTRTNVPVYNVSASLMREHFPDRPFRLIELAMHQPPDAERRTGADRRDRRTRSAMTTVS